MNYSNLIWRQSTALATTLAAIAAVGGAAPARAAEVADTISTIDEYTFGADAIATEDEDAAALDQVTSVSQLSDVQPTDWAFQALQSLVERYGCIAGYPDGTFRGNRALTRYEFAAGLNACLSQVEELIASSTDALATKEDLRTLQKLQEEFAAELAILRGRVDSLEARASELEANQFSTTTKLQGEVIFNLGDTFGNDDEYDTQTAFSHKVRLQLVTSFTGKDRLYTRLTTGNIGNGFADQLGTNEGRYAYDGPGDNVFDIDRLHYVFPVGDKLTVTTMASLGGHHFYADTFNPGLEAGGGGKGALSRFGERNPIYRQGLGGQGVGLRYKLSDSLELSAGYLARGGNDPSLGRGLFNGNYSIMGQVTFAPSSQFKIGATYLHGYDPSSPGPAQFALGGTGTGLANMRGVPGDDGVSSNTYGLAMQYDVSPKFSVRAWGGYTDATLINRGDAEVWTYAAALVFPDLLKEGNMGYVVAGAEPYMGGIDAAGDSAISNDVPLHIELGYKIQVNDNIMVTPGLIWLTAPQQDNDNDDVIITTVRTTFSF